MAKKVKSNILRRNTNENKLIADKNDYEQSILEGMSYGWMIAGLELLEAMKQTPK